MLGAWKASRLITCDGAKQHNFLTLFPRDTIRLDCSNEENYGSRSKPQRPGEGTRCDSPRIKPREPSTSASTGRVQAPRPREQSQRHLLCALRLLHMLPGTTSTGVKAKRRYFINVPPPPQNERIGTCTRTHSHTHSHTCTRTHTHTHMHTHSHARTHTCAQMRVHTRTLTYIHTLALTPAHTHSHSHTCTGLHSAVSQKRRRCT